MNDAALYDKNYFVEHYAHDAKRERMYCQEYARLSERMPDGGFVLDIGCGTGGFLCNFGSQWHTYGFDPSSYALGQAARKGINICEDLAWNPDATFDLVVMRGTLQHMSNPMPTLDHATRLLRPGGMLAILATPDTDSLVYRIWFELPALEAQRNWVLFGNHYLQNILKRLGYDEIEVLHPYKGTPYARPVKDFCQFLASMLSGYRKFAFPGNMMEMYARKGPPSASPLSPKWEERQFGGRGEERI